jgi:hypothetical protein
MPVLAPVMMACFFVEAVEEVAAAAARTERERALGYARRPDAPGELIGVPVGVRAGMDVMD